MLRDLETSIDIHVLEDTNGIQSAAAVVLIPLSLEHPYILVHPKAALQSSSDSKLHWKMTVGKLKFWYNGFQFEIHFYFKYLMDLSSFGLYTRIHNVTHLFL